MNILFLMYPWERIDPDTDSTIRMIHECVSRKHTVALATVHNLTMRESTPMAFCNVFIKSAAVPSNISTFYKNAAFRKVKLPLAGFDAIVMRSDPPLNVTALNFLDSVRDDVFIMNDIDGLRIANNKLYTSSFDDPNNRFIPKTYVSKTPDYLESVLQNSATDKMIMKPLDGYGGAGVIMVEKQAQASFRSLLDFYINNSPDGNYVILQEYVEGADEGDVRILMLNGEAIGAMKRVPAKGDVRSNVHAGGTVVKHVLTKTEKELCKLIGPKLVRDGLYFVGIDVINGKLIEVNVLSPGGIMRINKLNRVKLQTKIIDFIENVVNTKKYIHARKSEFAQAIKKGQLFHAVIEGAFEIKIEDYGFFVCTAIHDGHQLRDALAKKCALSESERLYEEDPFTGEMISSMPITLIGLDSRYEYDLNRPPESCVYKDAWGKQVWSEPLTEKEIQISLNKHALFYRVLGAVIKKVEKLHGNCLVYDLHSYNHLRMASEISPPTFNIGTEQLDSIRWGRVIKHWNKSLGMANMPNIDTRSAIDEVFFGRGYLATFVKQNFKNTLALPTEVKKVFMNELSGEPYPLVLDELKSALKQIILSNALYFAKQGKPKTPRNKTQMLSSELEPAVLRLDKKLYRLASGISTLSYINPKNIVREKKRFFAKNYNYTPEFSYRQLEINPFEFREQLYRLPENDISDITIQQMYRDTIDSYATKIDLLATVGTENFLYNSLRYYGEPSEDDIQMAHFILYAKPFEDFEERTIDAQSAKECFLTALKEYNIQCKVEVTDKIIASAMVDNAKKTILINKSMKMNQTEINALIHHELGVHMVTTVNADLQALKIFKLGLPGNTYTQEGLAILSEYMTGNMNLPRLKTLALRVIAVKMMINQYDFSHTFKTLMNDYGIDRDEAFRLTARVYRAGGFTKDFLYLRGLKDALKIHSTESLEALYIGKTSFAYLKTINEMTERGMVTRPTHLPMYLKKDMKLATNPILDYLMHSSD